MREILKLLRKDGWYIDHWTGSHRQMKLDADDFEDDDICTWIDVKTLQPV